MATSDKATILRNVDGLDAASCILRRCLAEKISVHGQKQNLCPARLAFSRVKSDKTVVHTSRQHEAKPITNDAIA